MLQIAHVSTDKKVIVKEGTNFFVIRKIRKLLKFVSHFDITITANDNGQFERVLQFDCLTQFYTFVCFHQNFKITLDLLQIWHCSHVLSLDLDGWWRAGLLRCHCRPRVN